MLRSDVSLYFIRHGQTDWNAEGRYQGQLDIPLNDTGRGQAARNGRKLGEIIKQLDAYEFVASPLLRTRQTMEIVRREMDLPPQDYRTDRSLKEIDYGAWEGFTLDDLSEKSPEDLAARDADKWGSNVYEGESYSMLSDRTLEWLKSVNRDSVIVSHGAFSRCVRGHILGLGQNEIIELDVPQNNFFSIRQGQIDWY